MNLRERTEKVRHKALELGFDACGFARARRLDREARRLREYLDQGRHGNMGWLENHFEKRVDPTKLVPGSKSVVSVVASYYHPSHERHRETADIPKIAKYAQGRDYHKTFKKKLKYLFQYTEELLGELNGRIFTDSAPVLDKAWANRAGLGWIGKNANLLNRQFGSYLLIGEMIVDAAFIYNTELPTDHCGSCTRCIEACPTDAIHEPYRVDGSKCISYFTIEMDEPTPAKYEKHVGEWLFGCDICQDVCPWNRKPITSSMDDFEPREPFQNEDPDYWQQINADDFDYITRGSAVRRAGYEKFKDNARIVIQNLQRDINK